MKTVSPAQAISISTKISTLNPEVRLKIEQIAKKHAIDFDNFDSTSPLASLLLFVVLSISSSDEFYKKMVALAESVQQRTEALVQELREDEFQSPMRMLGLSRDDFEHCRLSRFFEQGESESVRLGFRATIALFSTEFDHARRRIQCQETVKSLSPMMPIIVVYCWLDVGDGYALIEKSPDTNDEEALAAKLLQLEKQIVFSTAMMNRQPEFIGFTSTSDYSEEAILCRLRQFIRDHEYAEAVPLVHEFLQREKFKLQQLP